MKIYLDQCMTLQLLLSLIWKTLNIVGGLFQGCDFLKRLKFSLWSIIEQLRHMVNHLLQVLGWPLLLWVKVCNFTWQLMGSSHLLNKDLCPLHLLFHLERRAGRKRHKLTNLTCETALRLFQIYDANLKKKEIITCDSMSVSILIIRSLWKTLKLYSDWSTWRLNWSTSAATRNTTFPHEMTKNS